MRMIGRAILALGLVAASVVPALASPAGVWELETRDTRFALELCGDGTQLCGRLVWLSDTDYNRQYEALLDKPIADQMRQTGANRWKGAMHLFGQNITGTITKVSADQMSLTGCAFLVVCKSYQMFRYSP